MSSASQRVATEVPVVAVQTAKDLIGSRGMTTSKIDHLLLAGEALLLHVNVLPSQTNVVAPFYQISNAMRANTLVMRPSATCWPLLYSLNATNSPFLDLEHNKIESTWLAHWKECLGQPARTPRQVMHTYCDVMNFTTDTLDLVMDWECWPELDVDLDIE